MKSHQTATRIIAGVLPAMALFATSATAQELQTQTAPPPVPVQSAPTQSAPAADPAPAPAASTTAPDAQARYQASLDAATGRTASAAGPADVAPPVRARTTNRSSATMTRPVTPPVATAPAAAAPVAAAPVAAPSAAGPAAEPAPAASTPAATAQETTVQTNQVTATGTPVWAWLIGGLAVLGAIALGIFALRRRRDEEVEWIEEDQYVDAAPIVAAPLALDEPVVAHAEVVDPPSEEVAALTEGAAPVAGRPWIELSLRPVRAGANDEAALVDLELTLANAGEVPARDVRVSTFMLGDAADAPTDIERLLAGRHAGTEIDAGAIGAGEGSRIDARLALPREDMSDATTFQPVVVADVRYTLPDGGEGRTAAAFTVGVYDDGDEPLPLRLGGDMREDIAATLHGVPERV